MSDQAWLLAGSEESARAQGLFFHHNADVILEVFKNVARALLAGGKIMIIGNGGSAADAQHLAAELVGRFERNGTPIPAVALVADGSILTCVGNDFGFQHVFSRQIEALARHGDIVLAISTSGRSANVLEGVRKAHTLGLWTLAFTGGDGGELAALADAALCVSSTSRTCRIQETLFVLGHLLCEYLENYSTTVGYGTRQRKINGQY